MAESKNISTKTRLFLDADECLTCPEEVEYVGFLTQGYNITVPVSTTDLNIPLSSRGVIKRLHISNLSCDIAYIKLDGDTVRIPITNQLILTHQPTTLTVDNDSTENSITLEVKIIGEES